MTDAEAPGEPGSNRLWLAAAVVAVAVSTAVNVYVAWGARAAFMFDEVATLLQGRVVLGMDVPHVNSPGYYPGWAVLTAPLWWFTNSTDTFYTGAIVVGLLVGVLTIWPLSRVASRLGVTGAQGVVAAAIVMALPARALQSDFALAERLIFLLVTLTALAAFRLGEKPTYVRVLLVSLCADLTVFTHARMQVFAVAVGLWLLLFCLRSWRHGVVGLLALGVGFEGANRLALHINALLVNSGFHQADDFLGQLADLAPRAVVESTTGEAWTQLIGTGGLVVLGLVAAIIAFRDEVRARAVGPYGFVLVVSLSLFALSSLRWARDDTLYYAEWRRFDYWFYGRYIDPVMALLVLVGVCLLLRPVVRAVSRATWLWTWALVLGIAAVAVLVVAPQAPTWAYVTPAHVPGAMPFWWTLPDGIPGNVHPFATGTVPSLTNANRFWLVPTVFALGVLALVTASMRVRHRLRAVVVAASVLVLACVGSAVGDEATDAFHDRLAGDTPFVHTVRQVLVDHPDAVASYETACRPRTRVGPQRNWVMWWMLPSIVRREYTWGDDLVFSCAKGFSSQVPGAVELDGTIFGDTKVWIMPGDLLDELREDGSLPPVALTVR